MSAFGGVGLCVDACVSGAIRIIWFRGFDGYGQTAAYFLVAMCIHRTLPLWSRNIYVIYFLRVSFSFHVFVWSRSEAINKFLCFLGLRFINKKDNILFEKS